MGGEAGRPRPARSSAVATFSGRKWIPLSLQQGPDSAGRQAGPIARVLLRERGVWLTESFAATSELHRVWRTWAVYLRGGWCERYRASQLQEPAQPEKAESAAVLGQGSAAINTEEREGWARAQLGHMCNPRGRLLTLPRGWSSQPLSPWGCNPQALILVTISSSGTKGTLLQELGSLTRPFPSKRGKATQYAWGPGGIKGNLRTGLSILLTEGVPVPGLEAGDTARDPGEREGQ